LLLVHVIGSTDLVIVPGTFYNSYRLVEPITTKPIDSLPPGSPPVPKEPSRREKKQIEKDEREAKKTQKAERDLDESTIVASASGSTVTEVKERDSSIGDSIRAFFGRK
jgi:hypothetical protein